MCFNSEVWYAVTQAQVSELEEVDKMTMRKVLSASVSAPLESLHLELGTTPLKYILKGRRIMFLHYLVSQKEEEMLSKFFHVQWKNPVRHDWTETVKSDLHELGLNFGLSQIKEFKKEQFAMKVKKASKDAAFKELITRKESHSKMSNLKYKELSMQKYLKSNLISAEKAKSLYKRKLVCGNVKFVIKQQKENIKYNINDLVPYQSEWPKCEY